MIDGLSSGAKTCQELATELKVNENALLHLLRFLTNNGFVEFDREGKYKLTSLSSQLQLHTSDSLYGSILSQMELIFPAWDKLQYSIKTGRSGFEAAFQTGIYEYLGQNAGAGINFNKFMEESTRELTIPALDKYDFSKVDKLVDVGGNTGQLTAALLQKYPHLQAIIFDLEYAIKGAKDILDSAKVSDRCQAIAGDFFKSVPTGGDLYLIARVIFNWDNDHAVEIIKNVRAAMGNSGKLLIFDMVLPSQGNAEFELMASLNLLALAGALLRTDNEYFELLEKAGFRYPNLIKIEDSHFNFIEAIPA
ncbi:MAG: methyltransferase [Moorea sp. SIO3C2]|nr:methyltransferase [Moorena sp. SIO3C2]